MTSPAQESEAILAAARGSLVEQRAGGRRHIGLGLAPIGDHSRALRRADVLRRVKLAALGVVVVLVAASVAGVVVQGIGFVGVMVAALALAVAVVLPLRFPRMKLPAREDLPKAPLTKLVGQVELWLEAQRAALPAPAVRLIDRIGGQLDVLNVQLAGLDEGAPAAAEVRRLVGVHLPELVSAYMAIPLPLRGEKRGASSPDAQIAESLGKISAEIDGVTRALADGALDRLAVQSRYLDYRYGDGVEDANP